jgi:hypothetical protein
MLLYVLCSAIYHVIRPNSLCGPGASGVASEINEIFAEQVKYLIATPDDPDKVPRMWQSGAK